MRPFSLAVSLPVSLAVSLLALGSGPVLADLTAAGKSSAVSADTRGTPPGQTQRSLAVGTEVFEQERVVTGPAGPAQLLFLDGSSATVGANGELVLDNFVYDKASGSGKLAMNLAGGAMRFVGGRLSKNDAVVIKTPNATIGIRGGVASIGFNPQTGATQILKQFGSSVTITGPNGNTQTLTSNGFGLSVNANGQVGTPTRWSPEQIRGLNGSIENNPSAQNNGGNNAGGGNGGTTNVGDSGPNTGTTQPPAPPPVDPGKVVDVVKTDKTNGNTNPAVPSLGTTDVMAAFVDPNKGIISPQSGTGTFGSDNLLTNFDVGEAGAVNIGTATKQEAGGTQFLQWARWAGGTVAGYTSFTDSTVASTSGYHVLVGTPTVTLPGAGQVTYILAGATKPTYADGVGGAGTFTGYMTANFSGGSVNGSINGTASMSDGSYSFGMSYETGSANFSASGGTTGSGRACGGQCSENSAYVHGFFAGPNAENAGIVYQIGSGSTAVNGAAGFKKQ